MQQREVSTSQTESTTEQDVRQTYEAPTFRQLASSETQTGTNVTPDGATFS